MSTSITGDRRVLRRHWPSRAAWAAVLAAVTVTTVGTSVATAAGGESAVIGTQDNAPWGLDRIDQRALPLDGRYSSYFTGEGVDVYVISSGVRATHNELSGRTKAGWSLEADTTDCFGTGTQVAGVVGGTTYGVAKGVSIVPVKVVACDGQTADLAGGINWVVDNHTDKPAVAVTNLLVDGRFQAIDDLFQKLIDDGITLVQSGVDASDSSSCLQSPARLSNAITVLASTAGDRAYLDAGSPCDDIYAPGEDIITASANSDVATTTVTSSAMAAAHVAGVAALLLQEHPTYTPAQVWQLMDTESTKGVLDRVFFSAPNKLLHITDLPWAPTGLSAELAPTPGIFSGTVHLTWNPSADPGAAAITGYVIEWSADGAAWDSLTTWSDRTYFMTGLENGTTYKFRVAAKTDLGRGDWSQTIEATPRWKPTAPTGLAATVAPTDGVSSGDVKLTWGTPSDNGADITDYTIESSTDGTTWTPVEDGVSTSTTYTFHGLTGGTRYWFRVGARNAIGLGPSNEVDTVALAVPSTPTNVRAVVAPAEGLGSGQVKLRWGAPASDGGADLTDYRIETSLDGIDWFPASDAVSTETTSTLSGLSGIRVWFRVRAVTAVGNGTTSDPIQVTPRVSPATPLGLETAVAPAGGLGSGQVKLTWGNPIVGTEVTGYVVESSADGTTWTSVEVGDPAARSYTFDGLTNFTTYRFRLSARNTLGVSSPSEIQATPLVAPLSPSGLAATAAPADGVGSDQVRLSWDPVPDAQAVTDYVVQYSADGSPWSTVDDGVSTTTTFVVGGLTNGTPYTFRVAARNPVGDSGWSGEVAATPISKPSGPTGIRADLGPGVAGSGEVQVAWNPPLDDGGSAVTDYVIQVSTDDGTWTAVNDGVSTATTFTVGGLTNGTEHWFRVAAVNAAGTGPWSPSASAVPEGPPAAPIGLTAAVAPTAGVGPGQVRLRWTAPIDTGGLVIVDYELESSVDGTTWTPLENDLGTETTFTVDGLTDGTRYRFRVAAVNPVGRSAWSVVAASPAASPSAAGALETAVAPAKGVGSGQVRLTWAAAPANGAAVTDYVIQRLVDGARWATVRDGVSAARSRIVSGLVNGRPSLFRVGAVNLVGRGPWSIPIAATPRWKPAHPGGLRAAVAPASGVRSGQVRLAWTAPANHGAPVTDYVIQRSIDGKRWTTVRDGVSTVRSRIVSRLSNGTRYRFRVAAVNLVGRSPWSSIIRATPRPR